MIHAAPTGDAVALQCTKASGSIHQQTINSPLQLQWRALDQGDTVGVECLSVACRCCDVCRSKNLEEKVKCADLHSSLVDSGKVLCACAFEHEGMGSFIYFYKREVDV